MKLENQVVNLELSKKLKELGVKQESYFWHRFFKADDGDDYYILGVHDKPAMLPEDISAYTVAELLEMSPASTSILKRTDIKTDTIPRYYVETFEHYRDSDWDKNPANALAKMLIYLIENKLIKP